MPINRNRPAIRYGERGDWRLIFFRLIDYTAGISAPPLSSFSLAAWRAETKKLPTFHIEKCGELGYIVLS